MICGACVDAGRCIDAPTVNTPTHFPRQCPECHGPGCSTCSGTGQLTVRQCPISLIDAETHRFMRLARMAERGVLPGPGSLGEQNEYDVHAIEYTWGSLSRARAEKAESDE